MCNFVFLLLAVCLLLTWLVTRVALLGFNPVDATTGLTRPMGGCRTAMLAPARWLIRAVLFIFGVCVMCRVASGRCRAPHCCLLCACCRATLTRTGIPMLCSQRLDFGEVSPRHQLLLERP